MSSNPGRSTEPPSHPQAAANDAVPAPAASRRNPRRSTPNLSDLSDLSVMTRKPPTVPPRHHGPQRRRIDREDQHDVHRGEGDEDPDCPEVPIAGRLESAKQGRQPTELRRPVD